MEPLAYPIQINRNLMLATPSGIGAHGKKLSGPAPAMSAARIRFSSAMRLAPSPESPRRSLKAHQRR
jgi:hypothetical protein